MVSFCLRKDYDGNEEAKGYVAVSGGRGPGVIFDALFSVVAFNAFAVALADCDGRVLGGTIAFTSVVSTLATIEGVLSPILSPLLGGIADTTPHRKLYLGISFGVVVITLGLQGMFFLSTPTDRPDPADPTEFLHAPLFYSDAAFLALSAIILVNVVSYELAALLSVSYAPELTKDEVKQMGYIADSYAANNGSQLFFLIVAIGITLPLGLNSFEQGAASAFICMAYSAAVFYWGFFKLGSRRDIDKSLDSRFCGVPTILRAIYNMAIQYKEILKFLLSWGLVSASVTSSVALATTYFQLYLGYKGTTVSILLGLALLMSVPGSILSRVWHKKFGIPVKKLYIAVSLIYGLTYMLAPLLLISSPRTVGANETGALSQFGRCENATEGDVIAFEAPSFVFYMAILFVVINGLCLGHIYPLNTQFYSLLIPGGQENVYYGMKVTFAKALTWIPPLSFTLISELNDGDLQFSLFPMGIMFLVGGAIATLVDVDKGMKEVKETLKFRQGVYKRDPRASVDNVALLLDDNEEVDGVPVKKMNPEDI